MSRLVPLAAVLVLGFGAPALAAPSLTDDWRSLTPAEMAETRGGFAAPGDYLVRFGVEVSTYANGTRIAHGRLGEGAIGPGLVQLSPPSVEIGDLPPGLDIDLSLDQGRLVHVLRNDLDHQVLRSVATVDVDVFHAGRAPTGALMDALTGTQALLGLR